MAKQGEVIAIHVAPTGAAPMRSVANTKIVVGRGLEGDRYYSKLGTYSNEAGSGRDVTLIEIEAIEGLKRDYKVQLEPGQVAAQYCDTGHRAKSSRGTRISHR